MRLLKVIFLFEWRQLSRQPVQWLILSFFLFAGLYSISNGHQFMSRQLKAIDSLHLIAQTRLKESHERFHADTSTETGKALAAQAGNPNVIEFHSPPFAINDPEPLSALAVGQRDLMPYFDVVTIKRSYSTPPNTEIANPEKLANGNFDLSFVFIYLIPLLVIVWSHSVLAQEKEMQTDRLLMIQGANLSKIITYKLLFRFLIISGICLFLSLIGFVVIIRSAPLTLADASLWLFLMLSYIIFWFSLTFLIIRYHMPAGRNVIILLGIWLFFILLLPGMVNSVIQIVSPLPSQSHFAYEQRITTNETWELPIELLIDSFYRHHPELEALRKTSDTAKYGNKRFIAYYDLLHKRLKRIADRYYEEAALHNTALSYLNWVNPVTQMQSLVNANAETGLQDYFAYEQQVNRFQLQWTRFLDGYLLIDKDLKERELRFLPEFIRQHDPKRRLHILQGSLTIWLLISLLLFFTPEFRNDH